MHKKRQTERLRLLLRFIFLACIVYVVFYGAGCIRHIVSMGRLAHISGTRAGGGRLKEDSAETAGAETRPGEGLKAAEYQEAAEGMHVLPQYLGLRQENEDLFGWLTIEGTNIDYPVLQSADDTYYLDHDFFRNQDRYGSIFVKSWVDGQDTGDNLIIYGHNMKDDTMFGSLDLYGEREYYEQHSRIFFDTLYEEREYEVLGAFPSKVFGEEEKGFRYYEIHNLNSEEEFEDFYSQLKSLFLYDTGAEAYYGDSFLMLSTCSYHEEDGRFVVAAKRVR